MIHTLQKTKVFNRISCIHLATPQKCTHLAERKHGTCAMTYKCPEETKAAEVRRPKGWFWWSVHIGAAVACVFCWETPQCLTKSLVWGLNKDHLLMKSHCRLFSFLERSWKYTWLACHSMSKSWIFRPHTFYPERYARLSFMCNVHLSWTKWMVNLGHETTEAWSKHVKTKIWTCK